MPDELRLSLKALRAFAAVVEHGSIAGAAGRPRRLVAAFLDALHGWMAGTAAAELTVGGRQFSAPDTGGRCEGRREAGRQVVRAGMPDDGIQPFAATVVRWPRAGQGAQRRRASSCRRHAFGMTPPPRPGDLATPAYSPDIGGIWPP